MKANVDGLFLEAIADDASTESVEVGIQIRR